MAEAAKTDMIVRASEARMSFTAADFFLVIFASVDHRLHL